MTKPSALALLPLAIMAANVHAEDVYEMDNVVVTASRTAQTIDETLAPVTVISRKDIEQSQASSVPELLKRVPGMQVATNGGAGSTTGIYLRGTKTAQTLVLLDGQRIDSATSGSANLQFIHPNSIERIEVVRGPKSSLYGADAVGGVIQIFTRKGHGKPRLSMTVGGGSRGTMHSSLNYGGKVDNTSFNIGASHYETQGYDFTNDKNTSVTNTGANKDDDGYRNKSFFSTVSHTFSNRSEAGMTFTHNEGKSEYDADTGYFDVGSGKYLSFPYEAYMFFRSSTLSAWYSLPVNDIWQTRLEAGYFKDTARDLGKNVNPLAPLEARSTSNKRHSFNWQNDIAWQENQLLTAGIDYRKDRVETSPTSYEVTSRDNKAFYLQNQSTFENSDVQLGLRRDKNEIYGYKTTGNISWGLNLSDSHRLIASYGTAFRAPSMMDLYFPGHENPNLKPEEAKNAELELRARVSEFTHWSVSVFQNDMDDMLFWDTNTSRMENIDKARIRGIETSFSTKIIEWDVTASLTYLDPKNLSGNATTKNKVLERRARQLFSLDADRTYGEFSIGGTVRAQGKSYNDAANTQRLSGFATFDLRTGYRFSSELKGELKLVNLMDKEYQTAMGYEGEPRGVFVSMTWTPEI